MRHDEPTPLDDDLRYGPELSRTLDTALNDLPLRTDFLVAGAVARGTRTRRRKRVALWSTSVTTAAALTAAALLLTLPEQPPTVRTVALPDFSAVGSAPAGKEPVTGAATVALLTRLLPGDPAVTKTESRDSDPAYTAVQTYGKVTLADGGTVSVAFQGAFAQAPEADENPGGGPAWPGNRPTSKPEPAGPSHMPSRSELGRHYSCPEGDDACRIDKLGDGSVLLLQEHGTASDTTLTADVLRPDGTRVVVTAAGTGFRASQVQALATNKQWQQWVDPEVNTATEESGD
ncbi:hypothetical protein G3I32_21905 [Streptomyces coelicoflavus]|uniref:Uncharacterized protein n=1 Tax=Streptomyces coelicoflavus TaxID=285562 RepID=A0A7K3PNC6_9ACTN|nr:hypothetical protein [Streptomyces coelicoflavus]NEB11464.1 hypothetical protein [Streptomyces coelicoflavus]